MEGNNLQICRICISSNSSNRTQMISIFGEDSLWMKIAALADVKIEKGDTLPQQICVFCAKNTISAFLFKKKCEDADNFFRQQLLMRNIKGCGSVLLENECYHLEENCAIDIYRNCNNETVDDFDVQHEQTAYDINRDENVDVEDDGEIKAMHSKPLLDFSSIRLMHEYMQQQLSQLDSIRGSHNAISGNEIIPEDEEPLPLIPEVEMITPSEDMDTVTCEGIANTKSTLRGYQCPTCFQIFEMKQVLKAHMQSLHGTSGPVYECSNCKKTYFYKRFLEKHIRRGRCVRKRRNQTRPMQCSDCQVLFPTGHHLGWHKRTGCPSRGAKMPLQQLFKQNIVEFNNFTKRIGSRKQENAFYLHNRKLIMTNNKRKGRTRIKLDAKKIALAKQLILREATTTVIANELNISRTFAWRLRKSLINGISLQERVIDQNNEEQPIELSVQLQPLDEAPEILNEPIPNTIGAQNAMESEETCTEKDNETKYEIDESNEAAENIKDEDENENMWLIGNIRNNGTERNSKTTGVGAQLKGEQDTTKYEVKEEDNNNVNDNSESSKSDMANAHLSFHQQKPKPLLVNHITESRQIDANMQKYFPKNANNTNQSDVLSLLNTFSGAINQLPVNLSIRPIATIEKSEASQIVSSKKPRKPNVFIDEEKYALARTLVSQNASTMEIARALNVSQMTAWKVRDAIVKGLPLSYRNRRDTCKSSYGTSTDMGNENSSAIQKFPTSQISRKGEAVENVQDIGQAKHQELHIQQKNKLLRQKSQMHQQKQQVQLLQKEKFCKPQQQVPQPDKELRGQLQQQLGQEQNLLQVHQHQHHQNQVQKVMASSAKMIHPRRRLKAAEREWRDKEITREILELIREDSNIQYWKVSARLAEKGYAISPSSVCQKLKSMGIHRRWKPGDKPPILDIGQLKSPSNFTPSMTNSFPTEESYEHQFEVGGAHFLSAFTH